MGRVRAAASATNKLGAERDSAGYRGGCSMRSRKPELTAASCSKGMRTSAITRGAGLPCVGTSARSSAWPKSISACWSGGGALRAARRTSRARQGGFWIFASPTGSARGGATSLTPRASQIPPSPSRAIKSISSSARRSASRSASPRSAARQLDISSGPPEELPLSTSQRSSVLHNAGPAARASAGIASATSDATSAASIGRARARATRRPLSRRRRSSQPRWQTVSGLCPGRPGRNLAATERPT